MAEFYTVTGQLKHVMLM